MLPPTFKLRVEGVERQSDNLMIVTLGPYEQDALLPTWQPGAHVDVFLPGGLIRRYSLCGPLSQENFWQLAIQRERYGKGGSKFLHRHVKPGLELTVSWPRNNFCLDLGKDDYVFVAGGIGITPLISMIELLEQRHKNWHLYYGAKSRNNMLFLSRFNSLDSSKVSLWSEEQSGLLPLRKLLQDIERPNKTAVYCCGPAGMMSSLAQIARDLTETYHIYFERFSALVEDKRPKKPFRVIIASTGKSFTIKADENIGDILEAAGVPVLLSCREGICGSCETTVLEGVPEHRDSIFREQENIINRMMICCSRSQTEELILDL